MAVENIENYLDMIDNQIDRISPTSNMLRTAKQQVTEDVEEIRTGSLPNLRILCEGD